MTIVLTTATHRSSSCRRRRCRRRRRRRRRHCHCHCHCHCLLVRCKAVNDRRGDVLVHVRAVSDRHARDVRDTHRWCLEIVFDHRFEP